MQKKQFKVHIVTEWQEKSEFIISGKKYKYENDFKIQKLVIQVENMLYCEAAFLRYIAMSHLGSKRLEMSLSDNQIDISHILCTNKYTDEFDLINKIKLIRIDQNASEKYILSKFNDKATEINVTTDDILSESKKKLKMNKHILCQLKPGREIMVPLRIVEGIGKNNQTFVPFITFLTKETSDLSNLNPRTEYYQINKQEILIENDNNGLNSKQLLTQAFKICAYQLSEDSILDHQYIGEQLQQTIIWYPQHTYQFGNLIQMIIPYVRQDVISTFTDSDPNYEGLIIKFKQPNDYNEIKSILLNVAKIENDKFQITIE